MYTAFLTVERSVILGFLVGGFIFLSALVRYYQFSTKKILVIFLVILSILGVVAFNIPKVKYGFHLLASNQAIEQKLNRLSSQRIAIAKGALELIANATKQGDYTELLIGWGYGPQKQYNNLPAHLHFINEYESFVFLTEFINGGLINLIFLLWFYGALIYLTLKVLKNRDNLFMERIVLISAVWVNMGYHLFTLFWVPLNALFYIYLALIEKTVSNQ